MKYLQIEKKWGDESPVPCVYVCTDAMTLIEG